MTDTRVNVRAGILGGVVAGVIAGVVMAMVAMIRASVLGLGFWLPVKQIAALWYGVDALILGAGAVWVGLLTHLVVAALYGLLFGTTVGRTGSMAGSFAGGLLYGVAIWAVMTWVALPLTNEVMLERVTLMPWWWFGYHLIFGGMLFLTPPLVNAFAAPRTEAARTERRKRAARAERERAGRDTRTARGRRDTA